MIVSNPPYLRGKAVRDMKKAGWPEPALALDGGDDGLDLIRELVPGARRLLRNGGYILIEADPWQMEHVKELLSCEGFADTTLIRDLAGSFRIIKGKLPP